MQTQPETMTITTVDDGNGEMPAIGSFFTKGRNMPVYLRLCEDTGRYFGHNDRQVKGCIYFADVSTGELDWAYKTPINGSILPYRVAHRVLYDFKHPEELGV